MSLGESNINYQCIYGSLRVNYSMYFSVKNLLSSGALSANLASVHA